MRLDLTIDYLNNVKAGLSISSNYLISSYTWAEVSGDIVSDVSVVWSVERAYAASMQLALASEFPVCNILGYEERPSGSSYTIAFRFKWTDSAGGV